jgi:hypothetical protein
MGFCAFSEDPRGILCIFGSSSQDCAYLRVPHGSVYILEVPRGILCIFVHFILSLFVYKIHVFATCILIDCGYRWLQTFQNVYPGNTAKVDAEEADRNICLAKMSLIRTKPDHFYDMI